MTTKLAFKKVDLSWIKLNAKYYLLNLEDHSVIAITIVDKKSRFQEGYRFKQEWNPQEQYHYKFERATVDVLFYLSQIPKRKYDITTDFYLAISIADRQAK